MQESTCRWNCFLPANRQPLARLIPFHLEPLPSHHLFLPRAQDASIRWQTTTVKWGARERRRKVPPGMMMGTQAGTRGGQLFHF